MNNFVSIIIVNYNGKRYLNNFLNSALLQNYPSDRYEVLVVDNGSTDGSVTFIEKNFPNTRVIRSEKNLGFGGGNNLGIRYAKGDLLLLVNNDTTLNKDTLTSLVSVFNEEEGKVGAIAAKLVLIDSYLPVTIEEAFYSGHTVPKIANPHNPNPFIIPHDSGNLFKERVFVPVNCEIDQEININLRVKPYCRNEFRVRFGEDLMFKGYIKSLAKDFNVNFDLTKVQLVKYKKNLIQNSGNFFFRDGSGRDRGAVIASNRQYYEEDDGQYDKEEDVPAFCGAGVLINKKALEDVGYFDENFFMYYEDADLSFRLRENGWRIVYSPKSVIRHVHAGSSKEWSDLFTFNAERGRLLFVSKHWPRIKAVQLLLKYFVNDTLGILFYSLLKRNLEKLIRRFPIRLKVCVSVVVPFLIGLLRPIRVRYDEYKLLM
jgi:GT2 family glycosyltransferase